VVFPNPVTGPGPVKIHVPGLTVPSDVRVQVFTSAFRKIQEQEYSQVPVGMSVPLSLLDKWGAPLANGIYYVRVKTPAGWSTAKLLIIR
jgi:hypothetical protein